METVDLTDDEKDPTEEDKIMESDSSYSENDDDNDDVEYFNFFINNINRENELLQQNQIEIVTDNDESQDLLA
jgi:hypothetical protein